MAGATVLGANTRPAEAREAKAVLEHNKLVDDVEAVRASTAGALLTGSGTYDPASLVDGAGVTTTLTVTGAVLGDYVVAVSFSLDLQGITMTGYVSAANTVGVRMQNESGGTIDLGSGTLRALVRSFAPTVAVTAATLTAAKVADNQGNTTY